VNAAAVVATSLLLLSCANRKAEDAAAAKLSGAVCAALKTASSRGRYVVECARDGVAWQCVVSNGDEVECVKISPPVLESP
jgi:hypothetical protein